MSSDKKARKSKQKQISSESSLPDLTPIAEALHDAYCLVWTGT
jgi:hypothetical protein